MSRVHPCGALWDSRETLTGVALPPPVLATATAPSAGHCHLLCWALPHPVLGTELPSLPAFCPQLTPCRDSAPWGTHGAD